MNESWASANNCSFTNDTKFTNGFTLYTLFLLTIFQARMAKLLSRKVNDNKHPVSYAQLFL